MKTFRKTTSIALCLCILLTALPSVLLFLAGATAADDLEDSMLGQLSAQYESNGNPGAVADTPGDPGGKSYGLYMFASNMGSPKDFFEWCQASSNVYYQGIGNTLSAAYYNGGAGYGSNFDAAWRRLASENSDAFGRAQRDFVRAQYYDACLALIKQKVPVFDISNYSIALRNVIWSRAIQHGIYGAATVCQRAFEALGGFACQSEADLINAIYAESSRLTSDGSTKMSGYQARNYGVEGLSLAYYDGCSADVQLGVYLRLRINEPAKAQAMLVQYGYNDAVLGEGSYLICPASNTNLAAGPSGYGLSLNARTGSTGQQFRLVYYASGCYTITNADNSLRLTAAAGSVSLAAPVAGNSQLWSLVRSGSSFALKNRSTGQYLTASSFAAGGRITAGDTAAPWQILPGAANWTLTGASYPTYANGLQAGSSSFPFRGTLRSSYTITSVSAEIRNSAGKTLYSSTAKPAATHYDLSAMDDDMAFSRLSAGSYSLVITAADVSGSRYELNSPFYVADGTTYAVSFDPAGGTCSVTRRTFVPGQRFGDLPVPVKANCVFVGWFTADGTQITAASTTPSHNVALTARYTQLYTYTFYDADGTTVLASGTLPNGAVIPQPADPSRPATDSVFYTFSGWAGYTPGMTMAAGNVSFTATYEEHAIEDLTEMAASGPYRLADGYLRCIPIGTTAGEILDTLSPRDYITINQDGQPVTGAVATGMAVDFTVDGALIQQVAIVVTGDVNGDGRVTLTDMVQIRAHLLGRDILDGAALQAADLDGNGQITLTDFVQCLSAVLGRSTIEPK